MSKTHTRPTVAAAANTATGRWLRHARMTDDPAGDLIADMCRDPDLPQLFRNIHHMRGHLQIKGADAEAIATVPAVWRRYRKWLDRHPVV